MNIKIFDYNKTNIYRTKSLRNIMRIVFHKLYEYRISDDEYSFVLENKGVIVDYYKKKKILCVEIPLEINKKLEEMIKGENSENN